MPTCTWTCAAAAAPAGQFEFLGRGEQNDLYDVIEWIGAQPWSNHKVGGIGQSYFCMAAMVHGRTGAALARLPRRA